MFLTKKTALALGMLAPMALSGFTQVVHAAEITTNPDGSQQTVASPNGKEVNPQDLKEPSVSVTDNAFGKDRPVLAGDEIQWDVINTGGNKGYITKVTDTLPDELAFTPNSPKAVEFYEVNYDGTIGNDITSQWTVKISGQTMTATPKNPKKYFYVGAESEKSKPTRFMYRIYSVIRSNVPSGEDFVNNAHLILKNHDSWEKGKKKPGEDVGLTSNAKVHTPKYTKPTLIKQESKDGGKTWTDDLALDSVSSNYMYRIVVALPPQMAKESLQIFDNMEDIIDASELKVFWGPSAWTNPLGKGVEDVTDQFTITEKTGSDFTATASKDFIKQLRKAKDTTYVTLLSTKTDLQVGDTASSAIDKEIAKYPNNKVPNKASASVDDIDMDSNTVYVHVPKSKVAPAIKKWIRKDDGKVTLDDKAWTDSLRITSQNEKYDYHVDYSFDQPVELSHLTMTDTFEAIQDLQGIGGLKVYLTDKDSKTSDVSDWFTFTNPTTVAQATDGKKESGTVSARSNGKITLEKGDVLSLYIDDVTWKHASDKELMAYPSGKEDVYQVDNIAGGTYTVDGDRDSKKLTSNKTKVVYEKPTQPSIDIEKAHGKLARIGVGNNQDEADNAGEYDADTEKTAAILDPVKPTQLLFTITNNGNTTLTKVKPSNTTQTGKDVKDIKWTYNNQPLKQNSNGEFTTTDGKLLELPVNAQVNGTGNLEALGNSAKHVGKAQVTAVALTNTKKSVSDADEWHARTPEKRKDFTTKTPPSETTTKEKTNLGKFGDAAGPIAGILGAILVALGVFLKRRQLKSGK